EPDPGHAGEGTGQMSTSIFLARLIGPVMTLVGVSLLVDEAAFRKMALEFLRNPALIFFSGMIMMSAGLVVVLTHNVWVLDWHVIITLLGWVLDRKVIPTTPAWEPLISAAARLFAPQRATKVGKKFLIYKDFTTAAAAIWLVVGAVLCYFDFRSGVMS